MNPLSNATFVEHLTGSVRFVLPEAALVATACILFLLAAFRTTKLVHTVVALAGIGAAIFVMVNYPEPAFATENRGYTSIDPTGIAMFVRWLALACGIVYVLLAWNDTRPETSAEYLACVMVVIAGLSLVGRANDLVTLFLALEMISIPTYVLLYLPTRTQAGQEAAMKYFMLSVLSAGVLLFGFSYLYGITGATNIANIVQILSASGHAGATSPMAILGILFVIAGLSFRLAAVPFHFYAPDVYEGGPNGVIAQLAYIPKIAGFVALARLLGLLQQPVLDVPFDTQNSLIPLTLWVIAAITMTFGNLLAMLQENVRRMLAYSGIAHGGYMLIGILVAASVPVQQAGATQSGLDALLFYLIAYGLMTVGAFAILAHLAVQQQSTQSIDDLAGLGKSHPWSSAILGIFLVSLIGLPLTAGFAGKFMLFFSAFEVPPTTGMKNMFRILVGIAAINAGIAAVYYLRVLGVLYLRSPLKPSESKPVRNPAFYIAALCAIATLLLGMYPNPVLDEIRKAAPVAALPADE